MNSKNKSEFALFDPIAMFSGIKAPFIPYQVIRDQIDPNNEKS